VRVHDKQVHGIGTHVQHAEPHTMTLQPSSPSSAHEESDVLAGWVHAVQVTWRESTASPMTRKMLPLASFAQSAALQPLSISSAKSAG
jgi:hypothetical protein